MPNNQYVNKVDINGATVIDLTGDTITASKLERGFTAHDATGAPITGTATPAAENGSVYQDEEGYVVLDDEPGVNVSVTSLSVTSNGTYTAPTGTAYSPVSVNVQPSLQSKSATPSETAQTITPDSGYDGLSQVSVGAISSTYVGSGITQRDSDDLTASGATITAPAGYYSASASKSVATATHPNPTASINSTTGVVTASHTQSTGYVTGGTTTGTLSLTTQAAKTVTPTESEQTAVAAGRYTTGEVKVGAISSTYVGSGITQRDSDDLTASGATVTAPAGYYASSASKSVASGTAGTPTATKGTVSNHSISITPSVTNTTGYITGGTKTGTAVSVSASELVSGTLSVTSSGTKDVTNYASASVPAGAEGTPSASKGTVSNNSISVTPSVTNTSGFISGGTHSGTAVTVSASELVSGTKSITENGTGIDVTNYASVDVSVSATPKIEALTVTPSDTDQTFTAGTEETQISYKRVTDGGGTETWSINLASSFSSGDTFQISGRIGRESAGTLFVDSVAVDESFTWDGQSHAFSYTSGGYTYTLTINTTSIVVQTNKTTDYELTIYKVKVVDGYSPVTVLAASSESITVSPLSVTQNGIYTAPTGTAYSPVTVAVEGGGGVTIDQIATRTISGSISGNASFVDMYAFYKCSSLATISFPVCTSIGSSAFASCSRLTSAIFPSCTLVGAWAFLRCSSLATISFPVCTSIGTGGFSNCTALLSANFPSCTSIGNYAFDNCYALTTISFPVCTSIGASAFYNCYRLTSANFPSCTLISSFAFQYCSSLATISFPVCTSIGSSAFANCYRLTSAIFPSCTLVGMWAFYRCSDLTLADFPSCTTIVTSAFADCTDLESAYFPVCTTIGTNAFTGCTKLISLYLSGVSSVPSLGTGAFNSTPIGGYSTTAGRYGSVFVPSSLYESFLTATNWSTISSRIVSV